MANKRKGQLTVTGEWARHLRPLLRRSFWKQERQAGQALIISDTPAPDESGADWDRFTAADGGGIL